MEIQTEETTHVSSLTLEEEARRQHATDTMWRGVGVLWHRRRFIAGFTATLAIISIIIALVMPKWYAAEARVLQPEGGGVGGLMGMVNRATGGLGSLLGGGGGYERYLAILTSRSMMEDVVERFDLIKIYDIDVDEEDGERVALYQAVDELSDNVEFEVELDYDYLSVVAYDRDPERAAEMANFIVGRLNEENARLTSDAARQTRLVIERRLDQATADLDSIRSELQTFQEANGIIELESQAKAMMESVALSRAEAARLDVQYQTLARQFGPDNPQVQAARQARNAAQSQINQVLGGQDQLLPVSMRDLPALTSRYAELIQAQLIQREILETVYPIYEQALFQEQAESEAVQVIDAAVAPILAARPSRRAIVIGSTLTALLLSCLFVLGQAWLRRHAAPLSARLHEAARLS